VCDADSVASGSARDTPAVWPWVSSPTASGLWHPPKSTFRRKTRRPLWSLLRKLQQQKYHANYRVWVSFPVCVKTHTLALHSLEASAHVRTESHKSCLGKSQISGAWGARIPAHTFFSCGGRCFANKRRKTPREDVCLHARRTRSLSSRAQPLITRVQHTCLSC